MTEDYQQQITERVREDINRHIERLKQEHPELLLTRQWRIAWPKGFNEGHNVVSIVTSSKQGKHLIGELQFVLPGSLELDLDAVELVLKDEPFVEKTPAAKGPAFVDDPLDLLNDLVTGINGFLQSLFQDLPQTGKGSVFTEPLSLDKRFNRPLKVHNPREPGAIRNGGDVEETMRQMRRSIHLPEWFETIHSREVSEELLRKLAEGYLHYRRQVGHSVSLEEYFKKYTDYLQRENKLHHYCRYKGKAVHLDSDNWCTETYCSKKPFHSECPQVTLRFGAPPEDL